jgi:H+/gluconate symporter-like permease
MKYDAHDAHTVVAANYVRPTASKRISAYRVTAVKCAAMTEFVPNAKNAMERHGVHMAEFDPSAKSVTVVPFANMEHDDITATHVTNQNILTIGANVVRWLKFVAHEHIILIVVVVIAIYFHKINWCAISKRKKLPSRPGSSKHMEQRRSFGIKCPQMAVPDVDLIGDVIV